MNPEKLVFILRDDVRAVKACYDPGKGVGDEWFKTLDPNIAVGDVCIVPTNSRCGFTTVKVKEVDLEIDFTSPGEVRWIAGRVDIKAFDKLLADEAAGVKAVQNAERNRKREELRAQMLKDNPNLVQTLAITGQTVNADAESVTEAVNAASPEAFPDAD